MEKSLTNQKKNLDQKVLFNDNFIDKTIFNKSQKKDLDGKVLFNDNCILRDVLHRPNNGISF